MTRRALRDLRSGSKQGARQERLAEKRLTGLRLLLSPLSLNKVYRLNAFPAPNILLTKTLPNRFTL